MSYNQDIAEKEEPHMAKERFVETYSQGVANIRKIIVDTETGVNYLLLSSNMTSGCGVAVLVDRDGKPIVTPISAENQRRSKTVMTAERAAAPARRSQAAPEDTKRKRTCLCDGSFFLCTLTPAKERFRLLLGCFFRRIFRRRTQTVLQCIVDHQTVLAAKAAQGVQIDHLGGGPLL